MYLRMCMYVYMFVCMYICRYVCIIIYYTNLCSVKTCCILLYCNILKITCYWIRVCVCLHTCIYIYVKSRLFYGTWLAWQRRKASISHFLGAGRAKAGELNVKVGLAFRNCNIICYEGPVLEFRILDGFDKASIRGSKWSGLRL